MTEFRANIQFVQDFSTKKQFDSHNSQPDIIHYRFEISDNYDLLAFVNHFQNETQKLFYWEFPDEEISLLAIGTLDESRTSGVSRISQLNTYYESIRQRLTTIGRLNENVELPFFIFAASFFSEISNSPWNGFSPGLLYIPEWIIYKKNERIYGALTLFSDETTTGKKLGSKVDAFREKLKQIDSTSPFESAGNFQLFLNGEEKDWIHTARECLNIIKEKSVHKVVAGISTFLDSMADSSPIPILNTLRSRYPGCINFLFREANGKTFLGSTPERLMRIQSDMLYCDSLAGSAARDPDSAEDEKLGKALLQSDKNLREHHFVVDYLKHVLEPYSRSVDADITPRLQKLANIQHLHTPIQARLKDGVSPFKIIDALHPTPAVGGLPTEPALEIIRKYETYERGYYAGPIGWFTADGDSDIAVGLRSGLLTDEGLHLFAGAGLVEHSDPHEEYHELQMKMQPLLSAITLESNGV